MSHNRQQNGTGLFRPPSRAVFTCGFRWIENIFTLDFIIGRMLDRNNVYFYVFLRYAMKMKGGAGL
jgi:hypothetical protein